MLSCHKQRSLLVSGFRVLPSILSQASFVSKTHFPRPLEWQGIVETSIVRRIIQPSVPITTARSISVLPVVGGIVTKLLAPLPFDIDRFVATARRASASIPQSYDDCAQQPIEHHQSALPYLSENMPTSLIVRGQRRRVKRDLQDELPQRHVR